MKSTRKGGKKMSRQDALITETAQAAQAWDCEAALHERDKGPYHALRHRAIERVEVVMDRVAHTGYRTISTVRQMRLDGDIDDEQLNTLRKHAFKLALQNEDLGVSAKMTRFLIERDKPKAVAGRHRLQALV